MEPEAWRSGRRADAAGGDTRIPFGLTGLTRMHAGVEVTPVAVAEGSCAAARTRRSNMSAFRIHLSCLLSSCPGQIT